MDLNRDPTPDELAGMAWWNSLNPVARSYWCDRAGSDVPASTWSYYKLQADAAYVPKS